MILLILPTRFSLIGNNFMLPFDRRRPLQFHSWNCGIVIVILFLILPTVLSLLDKYFMPPFRTIRSLRFQCWKCGNAIYFFLLMIPTLLSLLQTILYIFWEQGHTFGRTMKSLDVQHHHQKIQIRSQNFVLKQIISLISVNVHLHIPDAPDFSSLTIISTNSAFKRNIHLHMRNFIGLC